MQKRISWRKTTQEIILADDPGSRGERGLERSSRREEAAHLWGSKDYLKMAGIPSEVSTASVLEHEAALIGTRSTVRC